MTHYLKATRHPWVNLLFLLPLLAVYEYGVIRLGGDQAGEVRNGADAWLRWGLERFGVKQLLAAPAAVVLVVAAWSWWRWRDRPADPVGVCFGMAFESGLFAAALWQLSRNFGPILDGLGVTLSTGQVGSAAQIVTFVGAGIYEEVLFRLGLFSLLYMILRAAPLPRTPSAVLSAAAAALLFSAAHHVGPYGEPLNQYVFLFRTVAGLYFTLLYVARGFGVAVGAHAGYDVLVGVAVG